MTDKCESLRESPSQTAGPYVHIGLTPNALGISRVYPNDLGLSPIQKGAKGTKISITGHVVDGAGMILRDVLLESWQADAKGLFNTPSETRGKADPKVIGWSRFATDFETGDWSLQTVKPGRIPAPDGRLMAPHISLWIVARGINIGLQTRIYFEDEKKANAECPVLKRIEYQTRVKTLLAKKTSAGDYRFDIKLQGEDETVFFDI